MLKLTTLLVVLGVVLGHPAVPGERIVGGHEADIEDYPWTLALLLRHQHYCGAVLIDPEFILTAAHCVDHEFHRDLSVRAGSSSKSIGGEIVDIVEIIIHPEYDPQSIDYDFAVGRLAVPITVPTARPVNLPAQHNFIQAGDIAHVSGWGTLEYNGPSPDILHAVDVPVLNRHACEYVYGERITERMFCAGPMEGGRDACQGDSGGPVVIDDFLAGLVSWGVTVCATPNYPGVYSKVLYVSDWIHEVMGPPEPEPGPEPGPGPVDDIVDRRL